VASYTVKQGDCLSSIASRNHMAWQTIWDHADNKDLRELRKNPNVLRVGDVLEIPDKHQKQSAAAANSKHKFVVKRPETKLRFRVLAGGKPVRSVAYMLTVDDVVIDPGKEIKTDFTGLVVAKIRAESTKAEIVLAHRHTAYTLHLGHLDPVSETTGLQTRLYHLGYYPGALDGEPNPLLTVAVWLFQTANDILPTGQPNDDTLAAIEKAYGM
jgi:murein DD-endopeptidase MepM/ murein hydrolase activator NlpD